MLVRSTHEAGRGLSSATSAAARVRMRGQRHRVTTALRGLASTSRRDERRARALTAGARLASQTRASLLHAARLRPRLVDRRTPAYRRGDPRDRQLPRRGREATGSAAAPPAWLSWAARGAAGVAVLGSARARDVTEAAGAPLAPFTPFRQPAALSLTRQLSRRRCRRRTAALQPRSRSPRRTIPSSNTPLRAPRRREGRRLRRGARDARAAPAAAPMSCCTERSDDVAVCWVCLCGDTESPSTLGRLRCCCSCPSRPSHPACLARWCLQQAGKRCVGRQAVVGARGASAMRPRGCNRDVLKGSVVGGANDLKGRRQP
eukprot:318457-Chlamydomonas_euryale.AAC.5